MYAQANFAGFVAHKVEKWTDCKSCVASVTKCKGDAPRDKAINIATRVFLKFPSDKLFELTEAMEHAILLAVGTKEMNCYTFIQMEQLLLCQQIPQ